MIQEFQNIFAEFKLFQWVLVVVFATVYALRFLYLLLFTARIAWQKKGIENSKVLEPVTLMITFRNEAQNVRENIPSMLEIQNLNYEVVAVDDFSEDNTLSDLGLLKQRYPRLKISSLSQETRYSIKLAQNIALKSAANNWVLVTPVSASGANELWLRSFVQNIGNSELNLVLGYSTIFPQKAWYNLFYRVENFFQQVKSAAYISNGIPFVYTEDNTAFKKENYFALGGYGSNIKEPYANLELIINAFIKRKNTILNFSDTALVRKKLDVSKTEFIDLLKKSCRIEKYLPFWKRIILRFDALLTLLFLPLLISCFVFCFSLWPLIFMLIMLYILAYVLIIKITTNRLNERKIFIPSLVYGLIMPYYKFFFRWHFNKRNGGKHGGKRFNTVL